jgi:hypothetical protein
MPRTAAHPRGPVSVIGRVRIFAVRTGKDSGAFRLIATVNGRQQERYGTRDLAEAKRRAKTWDGELGIPGAAVDPNTRFGEVVRVFLAPATHPNWGRKHHDRYVSLARNHLGAVAGKRCRSLSAGDFNAVLAGMVEAGYAEDTVKGVLDLIRAVVRYGQANKAWYPWEQPLYGVELPKKALIRRKLAAGEAIEDETKPGTVRPMDLSELPTKPQAIALREALAELFDWKHALMEELAERVGLRWGEVAGLSPEQWVPETRELHIVRQLNEYDNGRFEFTLPKFDKTRTVIVPADMVERMNQACAEAIARHDQRTRSGRSRNPLRLLFTGPHGGWWRRSNWRRRVLADAFVKASWPEHLTWHSLRHRFCVTALERLTIEDVSRLAGHHSPAFTQRKYVAADDDYLERARRATA